MRNLIGLTPVGQQVRLIIERNHAQEAVGVSFRSQSKSRNYEGLAKCRGTISTRTSPHRSSGQRRFLSRFP